MADMTRTLELAKTLLDSIHDDMTVSQLVKMLSDVADAGIEALTNPVEAPEFGLDERAGTLRVERNSPECLVADDSFSPYYAGFDYVAQDCVTKIGSYTIYSDEDSRVAGHIEQFMGYDYEEEDDEEY